MTTEVANQVAEHPLMSPSVESQPEKKPVHTPRSQGDSEPRKELVNSGTLNFEPVQEKVKAPKPQSPGTYRFGRLSHHSFFSRHHPHPQRVTHIQDLTGKPVCVVRDIGDQYSLTPSPQDPLWSRCLMKTPTIATPIGDPQSNQEPQLPSEAWKKELKTLASRIAVFTKENEPKDSEKEEPQREEGAKYSAETGRLIPASAQAFGRRHSRQGHRSSSSSSSRNGDIQTILKDQELLVLELLCQILQTDSLRSIQFWLLYAPQKEKDLALGLLQTAVAQLLPQPLVSIPEEKLLNQLQEVQESQERLQLTPSSQSPKKTKTSPLPKSERPEYIGKAQVLRMYSSQSTEEKTPKIMEEH
ncbi:protein TBATA isoform X6 [Erinaceus europaeus]|uniref:Protein TBATA isoform X6 n=1 Tax=Erinaceus europaeus TaxID=9365 RepID=A0ABM3Y6V9_ERIEU|nr:protein TBATA isoform X6 [Erinaceus europaeus]